MPSLNVPCVCRRKSSSSIFSSWLNCRDRRDRRLAHSDDADLGGLDQRDRQPRAQHARQRGGGHPAGGSSAGDDD